MILIDGYNLMHAAGLMRPRFGPGGLEKARRTLIGHLVGSLGAEAVRATVVFDAKGEPIEDRGDADPARSPSIRIEFAATPDGADARIEELIRQEPSPKRLTVVSSDARIRAAAERRGARAMSSDTFWRERVERRSAPRPKGPPGPEKPTGRAGRDSASWVREFGEIMSEADLRELAGPFDDEDEKP
jgi:predicted RNA-binding protein with PIN domain